MLILAEQPADRRRPVIGELRHRAPAEIGASTKNGTQPILACVSSQCISTRATKVLPAPSPSAPTRGWPAASEAAPLHRLRVTGAQAGDIEGRHRRAARAGCARPRSPTALRPCASPPMLRRRGRRETGCSRPARSASAPPAPRRRGRHEGSMRPGSARSSRRDPAWRRCAGGRGPRGLVRSEGTESAPHDHSSAGRGPRPGAFRPVHQRRPGRQAVPTRPDHRRVSRDGGKPRKSAMSRPSRPSRPDMQETGRKCDARARARRGVEAVSSYAKGRRGVGTTAARSGRRRYPAAPRSAAGIRRSTSAGIRPHCSAQATISGRRFSNRSERA